MTDRLRVGRLLVLGYDGTSPPPELYSFAERYGLGGVILFARNCPGGETVRTPISALRNGLSKADPGWRALVMVDQEGGRVQRIRTGVPHLPSARSLGEAGPDSVRQRVREQAKALAQLGFDVNLAPVCDVDQPGESGAIGDRSFGVDPEQAGTLAAAHVLGTTEGGVLPCAKHFPGHGAARVDSHLALPRVEKSLPELEAFDLIPFRAAVAANVPLMMAAHLLFPTVSPKPATLSPEWLVAVLRDRFGFPGVVISDDMEMGALEGLGSPGDVAVEAVRAGCDLLIYGRALRPELDVVAVAEALERELTRDRVDEALARASKFLGGGR